VVKRNGVIAHVRGDPSHTELCVWHSPGRF
jgi:hypothetical protein